MQESDDLCRRLWIHQEIWGGQLWGETDYSDQWSTPGITFQRFFSFSGLFISLSLSCCIDFSVLFFSVCKDLSEPNGSHLQGADSPVHPDSDWWHSAGTDRSTVLCQIIHIFTLTWKYWIHFLIINMIQTNGKRKNSACCHCPLLWSYTCRVWSDEEFILEGNLIIISNILISWQESSGKLKIYISFFKGL